MAGPDRRTRATRVSTRLVAIVVLPVLALAAFSAYEADTRWRVVSGAAHLSDDVERLSTLAPVAVLVAREMYLQGAAVVGSQHGFDAATVGSFLGVDLEAAIDEVQAEVDRSFAQLAPDDPAQRLVDDLRAVRRLSDQGAWTFEDSGYFEIVTALHELALSGLRDAQTSALGLAGAGRAQQSLLTVEASYDATAAVLEQLSALGGMTDADGDPALLQALGTATARLNNARADIDRLATGAVRDQWLAVERDPDLRAVDRAASVVLDQGRIGSTDPGGLARLFGTAISRLDAYHGIIGAAADDAAARAEQLGDEARQRALAALAVAALVIVLTSVTTALIARSIGRPLRRLSAGAEQIRSGDLDDVGLPTRGPREVRGVVSTLHEVVENLGVVEAQLTALAVGALDEPVLGEPVPGRIGESLHGSVLRLSESMHEREALATRLEHEATHDPLTGLPNRAAASREVERALARAQRAGDEVAIFYIDLDDFKNVNDNHGHEAGDTVLRVTAGRLLQTVRAGDFVARIGGDEFLVVAERAEDRRGLIELGERIVDAVSCSIAVGAATTRVGASVGIAVAGSDGDVDSVLRDADLAGYEAKARGRGRVEIFDDALRAIFAHHADVERSLRSALADGELELWYQPVVSAGDERARSVEALLRWHRPGRGVLLPTEFIPIAEATDLIIDVGRWVLDAACEQLTRWSRDPAFAHLDVAVNLSGRHVLSMNVVDDVRAALERWGVHPQRLLVEVTETVLVTDLPLVSEHLGALRAIGVRVALDDFGTGYTSLTHLRSLPVDVLKIDRSLVTVTSPADRQVLGLLVGTAHTLGMGVVAEGIETDEQRVAMRSLGCDELQGFLHGAPVPADDLRDVLAGGLPV
jgi:diguanylate cyclase (GGDEF)-like protein